MKFLVTSAIVLLASCNQKSSEVSVPGREIFDDFQSIMVAGDFEKLARQLDPEVLHEFRRLLEFTTKYPLEGSWFTGIRDNPPTTEALSAVSDSDFFAIYMKATAEGIGNPFGDYYSGGSLVTATTGSKGYKHFVLTMDDEYAFPTIFSFKQASNEWHLVEPSVVTKFARKLRAAKGGTTDG
jgi:hypothetical protein